MWSFSNSRYAFESTAKFDSSLTQERLLFCLLAFIGFRAEMIFVAGRERVLTGREDSTENKKNTDYDPADITRHSPNIIIVGCRNFA